MDYIPRPGNGAGMEEEIMGNSVRAVISLRIYSRPYFVLRAMGQTVLLARNIWRMQQDLACTRPEG